MLPDFLIDVSPKIDTILPHLDGATSRGVLWQAAPGRFFLDAPEVARYLVEEGQRITIDPSPQADEADVNRFLQMTPLAALFFQRGIPVFHAAAVAKAHGAILIAGDSGVGKSTLAGAIVKRGWKFIADDLVVVDLNDKGVPTVFPTFPEMPLWSDAMEKLGFEYKGMGRHILPMEEQFMAFPQPLVAAYRLSVHKDEIELSGIEGMKIFDVLARLLYNTHIADVLLNRAAFMRAATAIARDVPVRSLRRPRGRWCMDELADIVEKEYR